MKFEKIHNKGQARLFQNPALEFLTKTHPLVIWGIYLPVIIGFPYYTIGNFGFGATRISILFLSGMLFWTFFEYIMHRWIFHMVAESQKAQKFIYVLHGNHHHFPRDKERLFMPPVPSIIISSIIFGLMFLVMREN